MSDQPTTFKQYCIVELFGHSVIAGLVTEQTIGGAAFIRVDVPAAEGLPGFTKFYNPSAVYAMTPTDEKTAIKAVEGLRAKPLEVWKLNIREIPATVSSVVPGEMFREGNDSSSEIEDALEDSSDYPESDEDGF